MITFFLEYRNIFIFILCSFVLAIVLLVAVYILSFTLKVDLEKLSAYECGFQPFSETSYPFEVQFVVIAIMFLLFDIEVLYLFPLVSALYGVVSLDSLEAFIILSFYILLVGLLYEISRKVSIFILILKYLISFSFAKNKLTKYFFSTPKEFFNKNIVIL